MGKQTSHRTSNGYSMYGISSQWAMDNEKLDYKDKQVYNVIARNSFGRCFRWCYVSTKQFGLNSRTLSKSIDKMVEMNILKYNHTFKDGKRGFRKFVLLEPREMIQNFIFKKDKTEEISDEETEIPEGWE